MKLLINILISSLFLSSCIGLPKAPNYTYLTKEDLIIKGTRFYKDQKNKKMNDIIQISFKNLGYTLSQNECKKSFCLLKTTPKEIMVSSSGVASHSQYTSQVAQNITRDEIAWMIEMN